MSKFILSSDSTCDMPETMLAEKRIYSIPLTFVTEKDGKLAECKDDFIGDEARVIRFYEDVAAGMTAKTSQLTMHEHMEYFRAILQKEGKDIVHITLSSGLSGTYEQAELAAKMLREEIPEHTVYVVDSLGATVAQRLVVDEAEKLRDAGMEAAEAAAQLADAGKCAQAWIMANDLFHLKRGGRISGAAAVVGTLLNIKPSIAINRTGRLVVTDKVRGLKKSIDRIVKMVEKYGEDMAGKRVYVVHTNAPESAAQLSAAIYEKVKADVRIVMMGPVIGAHVGPGGIAAAFLGKPKIDKEP